MQREPITGRIRTVHPPCGRTYRTWLCSSARAAVFLLCCSTHAWGETYPLWAGAAIGEWEDAAHAIVLTDLSRVPMAPRPSLAFRTRIGWWASPLGEHRRREDRLRSDGDRPERRQTDARLEGDEHLDVQSRSRGERDVNHVVVERRRDRSPDRYR